MSIDLMQNLQGMEAATLDQLRQAESSGEGVRLPFPAMYVYWLNGDMKLKPLGGVPYFGGWATDADRAAEMVEAGEILALPQNWHAFEGQSGEKSYRSLGSRLITVCPIAYRTSWISNDGTRRQKFSGETGHTRMHMQYLCQMRNTDNLVYPVVLTTKGYQSKNLSEGLGRWRSALMPVLRQMNGARFPLSAFWLTFGTTGQKPEFESVGKTAQSTITPIRAAVPDKLTEEAVNAMFVGRDVLMENGELLAQAHDWLNAWKDESPAPANGDGPAFDEFGAQA